MNFSSFIEDPLVIKTDVAAPPFSSFFGDLLRIHLNFLVHKVV